MLDPKQIPFLVQLLDDESSVIQEKVIHELDSFGPTLEKELDHLAASLNPIQLGIIQQILCRQRMVELKRHWSRWFSLSNDYEKLECALSMITDFLQGAKQRGQLKKALDELAYTYEERFVVKEEKLLAQFLFKDRGIKGNELDYYNPQNGNLLYILHYKKGIPISLTCIYMLVGYRLGLKIEGCNFPGHFLARITDKGKRVFVDCFHGGRLIESKDIIRARKDLAADIHNILYERIDAETIIRRFLTNLMTAYQMKEGKDNGLAMIDLFKSLDSHMMVKEIRELTPDEIIADTKPLFKIGQVVLHKKQGYRAIIVDVDMFCKEKFLGGGLQETGINRNQPWFHVLVDGTDHVHYVPESILVEDSSNRKIQHPLLSYFFIQSNDGQYLRNTNPWPQG